MSDLHHSKNEGQVNEFPPLNFSKSLITTEQSLSIPNIPNNSMESKESIIADAKMENHEKDDPEGGCLKFIKKIFKSQEATKITEIVISCLAVMLISYNFEHPKYAIPYRLINLASMFYSIFAICVTVVWNCEKIIPQNKCLQTFFVGRKVYWHEIELTFAPIFFFANLTVFRIMVYCRDPKILPLTFLALIMFGNDWYQAALKGKKFKNKKVSPKDCITNVFKVFNQYPLVFNVTRMIFFMFVHFHFNARIDTSFFLYCNVFALFGAIVLTFLKSQPDLSENLSSKLIPLYKLKTYWSLLITTCTAMAILAEIFIQSLNRFNNGKGYSDIRNYDIYYVLYGIMFKLSLMDLYSQAIFNSSILRHDGEEEATEPTEIKTKNIAFSNLPETIENPFFIDAISKY